MLNRFSSIPLYIQIKNELLKELEKKQFNNDRKLKSEREYSEVFSVSRLTVRKAIDGLQREGYIERVSGKGTFFTAIHDKSEFTHVVSFTEDMLKKGLISSSKVLKFELIDSPKEVIKKLNKNTKVLNLKRIRFGNNIPLVIQNAYISYDLCPTLNNFNFENNSLYTVLEKNFKLDLAFAKNILKTQISDENETKLFNVKKPIAVFLLEQVTFLRSGEPVEYVESIYRGDKYNFTNIASR